MQDYRGAFALTHAQLHEVLATAGMAPSLHNAQPWRFHVEPGAILLVADRERSLPGIDPDDRELRIACGAALFTLRLALHGQGIRPLVTLLPDPAQPDVLAAVRPGGTRPITPELRRLLDAAPRRHTNRHPFSDTPVSLPEQYALRRAAQDEGAWLHIVREPGDRARLRDMAATAHRRQLTDAAVRDELARWTGTGPDRTDGVPASAGGPLPEPTTGWIHRDFTGGSAGSLPEDKRFEREPLIAVLTSHLTGRTGDLQAGQALQRVLLTATADGLAASFLSQVVEVPETREQLRHLLRVTRPPQVVLRIGRGYPVPATPRRPVTDLLDPRPTAEPGHAVR
ncbi:Acg family FMN-binding oxidoreductase [Pseudonocardia lacus]|uniref:Acg family FMN-binding oxidoreductase n=1 Tax=Pseudonocardia lacus TaxID=2835865 RepID=UPI001BDCBFE1|nr:nitroreductase family protein [Pseudonocardia lacus]